MGKLYVIGIGPGGKEHMTYKAVESIKESDALVGYTPYINYLGDWTEEKEVYSTGMTGEIQRCEKAIELAEAGKTTAIVSTGDAGLYGMAGPILELAEGKDVDVEIIPGVSSSFSAAADLGSPIMHDFATISLSDLMTPLDLIYKRIEKASQSDMVIALYNPRSKGRPDYLEESVKIMLKFKDPKTPVGIVKDSGRPGTIFTITTLDDINYEQVDMLTMVIIGNSQTYIRDGKIITPRGYNIE